MKKKSALRLLVPFAFVVSTTGSAEAGCVVHYYVKNLSGQKVKVQIWKTTQEIKDKGVAKFQFACWSRLPMKVWKEDGTLTYEKKWSGSKIPKDRNVEVDGNFNLVDKGKR